MTKLTTPILRETGATDRGKVLVAILHPRFLELRYRRGRRSWTMDYVAILHRAMRREVDEKRRQKG